MAEEFTPNVTVVKEEVDAQVVQPREPDADTVKVHEVSVELDRTITDPSADDAVQVPAEGRSPLEETGLPIAESPEQALSGSDAPSQTEPANDNKS
jgi:hypothetical protein